VFKCAGENVDESIEEICYIDAKCLRITPNSSSQGG